MNYVEYRSDSGHRAVCALVLAGVMTCFPKLIPSDRPGAAHVAARVKR